MYLDGLNTKQYDAVTSTNKYIRLIAGAGSGKTKVLTSRIAYLIDTIGVPYNRILAITFTNKAANEMKERVEGILGVKPPFISTFHSFCVRVLREEISVINYPTTFTILDDDDQKSIIKDIIRHFGEEGINIEIEPKTLINYISNNKNANINPSQAMDLANGFDGEVKKAKVYAAYEERLKELLALDFDDLLLKTVRIFLASEQIRNKWINRFDHILVDEFQDTNDIQYMLVKLLTSNKNNLFVVGDPDQTIYTWRGANVSIIMNYDKDFSPCQTIILDKNYRSTQKILDASNRLIIHNSNRVHKDLVCDNGAGNDVVLRSFQSQVEEAGWVVEGIKDLHKMGQSYRSMAILYRANFLSRQLEVSLIRNNIPYKIYGGMKFFERKEIKDSLSYLRLVVNHNDDLALLRIINSPKRGIGETTLSKIKDEAREMKLSLYDYLRSNRDLIRVSKDKVNKLLDIFFTAIEEAKYEDSYSLLLNNLLEKVDYYNGLEEDNREERIQNIKELMNDLMEYQNNNEDGTLEGYLQEITLYSGQDEMEEGDFVSLMTVHTAKGLEYDNVFLYGFIEGTFPSNRSIEESDEGVEEERRIAYVAITRAKKRLYISYNNEYSFATKTFGQPSRFIKEMDIMPKTFTPFGIKSSYSGKESVKPTVKKVSNAKVFGVNTSNRIMWSVGDKVNHEKYGEGTIIGIEDGIELTIVFKDVDIGTRVLLGNHKSLSKA